MMTAILGLWLASAVAASPVEPDLAYGSHPRQRLDLVVPATKGFPTVIFVHGGSLSTGDKGDEDYGKVCRAFPAAGIACANVNYRLAADAGWPAPAEDVASAVTWVRAHIAERGGDPDRLFLFGHSSGALLAALVGAKVGTAAVRGVVPMGSIMWDDQVQEALRTHTRQEVEGAFQRSPDNRMFASLDAYLDHWPMGHIGAGLPPFLLVHGTGDMSVLYNWSPQFQAKLKAAGVQCDLITIPDGVHGMARWESSAPEYKDKVADWLAQKLSAKQESGK